MTGMKDRMSNTGMRSRLAIVKAVVSKLEPPSAVPSFCASPPRGEAENPSPRICMGVTVIGPVKSRTAYIIVNSTRPPSCLTDHVWPIVGS